MSEMQKKINDAGDVPIDAQDEALVQLAAGLLKDHANHLNATTLQKLANARGAAVNRLTSRQAGGVNHSGGVLAWFGSEFSAYVEQHKMLSATMVISALLITLFAVQQLSDKNNTGVNSLERSDAFLLASELPPEAFADKGFNTWLVSKKDSNT